VFFPDGNLTRMETKLCPKCQRTLEAVEFYTKKRHSKKRGTYTALSAWCQECTIRESNKRSKLSLTSVNGLKRKNRELIRSMKAGPCVDCGGRFHPVSMDFDHRQGEEKVRGVSAMVGQSPETILLEIAKCDLVCANCHRVRTARNGGWLETVV